MSSRVAEIYPSQIGQKKHALTQQNLQTSMFSQKPANNPLDAYFTTTRGNCLTHKQKIHSGFFLQPLLAIPPRVTMPQN